VLRTESPAAAEATRHSRSCTQDDFFAFFEVFAVRLKKANHKDHEDHEEKN